VVAQYKITMTKK